MAEFIGDQVLIRQDKSEVKGSEALAGKVVAFYFSAMWCGQCKMFTPKLMRFYEAMKEAGNPFEVVFVTRDREEEDFLEYFTEHHGEWLAVKFDDELMGKIQEKMGVTTIPAMKVVKADGTVVVEAAIPEVKEKGRDDPEALFEEWKKLM